MQITTYSISLLFLSTGKYYLGFVADPQITISINAFLLIILALLILWMGTILLFTMRRNKKKKEYISQLEAHLKEKAETALALEKSDERYQQLIHSMNEGLIFTDESNLIKFANSCACSILGVSPESLLHRSLKNFVFGEIEILKNFNPLGDSILCSHREETQMIRGDGKIIWASLSISYPGSKESQRSGAVIVLTDITLKKEAETELNNLTVDLNQKIKQLNCLFDISDITGVPGITFDGIFERCLEVIPNGLKYTHDVCTEISFGDKRYVSSNFIETPWSFTVPIRLQKKKLGHITVGYLEEKPKIKKDPFHINEKILLKNIAEKLGQVIETRNIQQTLHESDYGKSTVNK